MIAIRQGLRQEHEVAHDLTFSQRFAIMDGRFGWMNRELTLRAGLLDYLQRQRIGNALYRQRED